MPSALVSEMRVRPVSSFFTVTFAPAITESVWSVTVPRMEAVILWATTGAAIRATRNAARNESR